jgi:16S rRNA (cytosine967-C5)-methyltransferase
MAFKPTRSKQSPNQPAKPASPQPASPDQKPAGFHVSPARREAYAILLELEQGQAHADTLLRSHRVSALSAQDRHLATTLVMGTLRWQIRLDATIRPLLARPDSHLDAEILITLRLGALQLLFLDRIPDHAAISESVALAKLAGQKFAAGMVNAVLRKVAALPSLNFAEIAQSAAEATAEDLAALTAHPAWMVERWVAHYGFEAARAICLQGQQQPVLAVRLDASQPELEAELTAEGIHLAPGALLTAARRVLSGDVTTAAAFRSGRLRIQDEGSQLIAELAGHGTHILDCCAAPGGKTLILAERNPQSQITACEIHPGRVAALRKRFAESAEAAESGSPHAKIEVLQADVTVLADTSSDDPAYDLILADVPCSGTGTLDRNPEIRHRLIADELPRQHERQCAILRGALKSAQQAASRVLYSTCSLEPEENAAVIAAVLADSPGWHAIPLAAEVSRLQSEGRLTLSAATALERCIAPDGSLTLLPGSLGPELPTDGFFAALLQR